MRILGVSCDYHDAAAALVVDGELVAAAEEERFTRIKHDSSLPRNAVASVLAVGDVEASQVDLVVFHEKPLSVLDRALAAHRRRGPRGLRTFRRELPVLIRRNLMVGHRLGSLLIDLGADRPPPIRYSDHHLSHAAAAFLPSPFATAATLTVDGIGEWTTAAIGVGTQNRIQLLAEQRYPYSLGLLYSLVTRWCGFEPNDGEYKVMGLAPFGEPTYVDAIDRLLQLHDDGSFEIDAGKVGWWGTDPARLPELVEAFDGPPRDPDAPISRRDRDLARSIQDLVEDAMLAMARHAHELTGADHLCLAGGVALNCVANSRLLREGPFEDIWIQPAAGDAGSAIGAALWYWHDECGKVRRVGSPGRRPGPMLGAQLGPQFTAEEISRWLDDVEVDHERIPDGEELASRVAGHLANGAIVGLFQGRMEFGPRALGNRSILADPRSSHVQRDLNLRVKNRESFRPFAPAVLWESAGDWFEIDRPSPFMLFTHRVAPQRLVPVDAEPDDPVERVQVARSQIPACTHVDGTARVQTVHSEVSPRFHRVLSAFAARTGCPVLLNTSFNRAGEPMVCTPQDALATALDAGLDLLVLEDCLVRLRLPVTVDDDGELG